MKLVTVACFANPWQAYTARAVLEDAGVHCVVADEYTSMWFPHYQPAMGGVKVQVREEDEAEATSILAGHFEDDAENGDVSEVEE